MIRAPVYLCYVYNLESLKQEMSHENNINLDAIPEYKIGYHRNEPVLSHDKIKVSKNQLVQDYIHGRNNMYNNLEPVRCALKPNEPLIPASSYLRGLLSEPKSTVSAGIVPLTSTSGSGPDPTGSGPGPAPAPPDPPVRRGSAPPGSRGRQPGPAPPGPAQPGPAPPGPAQPGPRISSEVAKLTFSQFKNLMDQPNKSSSEITSLKAFALKNQSNTSKYLKNTGFKFGNDIVDFLNKLEPQPQASSSRTPTIGTQVIQTKKKQRFKIG